MALLRSPDGGCPWDRVQTFQTIAPYTVEEAYEVADAIERQDWRGLKDELGDLLFQVIFHAQMAAEEGYFDLGDVIESLISKMVRRHPHVFGDAQIATPEAQTLNWEQIKAAERAAAGVSRNCVLDGVPKGLPPLRKAAEYQKRVARAGFDWPDAKSVLAKLDEEIGELKTAISGGADANDVALELGDTLFVLTNLALKLGLDAEAALSATNQKFARRFRRLEELAEGAGNRLGAAPLEELDRYWDQAKAEGL